MTPSPETRITTFDFVGGPYDGQRAARPNAKPVEVFGHIDGRTYKAGEYRAGTRAQRGKMIWHPSPNMEAV